MQNLPYPHAGSDIGVWKKTVYERLKAAYNNGAISDDDVTIIAIRIISSIGLFLSYFYFLDLFFAVAQRYAINPAIAITATKPGTNAAPKEPVVIRVPI